MEVSCAARARLCRGAVACAADGFAALPRLYAASRRAACACGWANGATARRLLNTRKKVRDWDGTRPRSCPRRPGHGGVRAVTPPGRACTAAPHQPDAIRPY
eukprot:364644-Chlamydomonas_euryale.AAC.11